MEHVHGFEFFLHLLASSVELDSDDISFQDMGRVLVVILGDNFRFTPFVFRHRAWYFSRRERILSVFFGDPLVLHLLMHYDSWRI